MSRDMRHVRQSPHFLINKTGQSVHLCTDQEMTVLQGYVHYD